MRIPPERVIGDQGSLIAPGRFSKRPAPIEGLRLAAPGIEPQVVDDIAAADDEDALLAQAARRCPRS